MQVINQFFHKIKVFSLNDHPQVNYYDPDFRKWSKRFIKVSMNESKMARSSYSYKFIGFK